MFLIGSGVYTLEIQVSSDSSEQEVHVFPMITIPMVVRLEPTYFYSHHNQVKGCFPELLNNWIREHERLTVVRHTLSDLLTVDGISPEGVFTRVVQTMEHFHGLTFGEKGGYVSSLTWRRFMRWFEHHFPDFWPEGGPAENSELLSAKTPLVARISGVNTLSFRSRIRALFDSVPSRELMPLIDNPRDAAGYLDTFILRVEATRNYLTHFSARQQSRAFATDQLEAPTLQCWSVLVFTLARFLGLTDELAGDLALSARKTMFLTGTDAKL